MLKRHWLALSAAAALAFAPAAASAAQWTIGLGGGLAPDYQGSDDYEAVPNWLLRVQDLYDPSTYVQVAGPKLSSNFIPHPNFRLGLSGQYIAERDDVQSNRVDKLKAGDSAIMLGLLAGYDFMLSGNRVVGLEIDGRYDVEDEAGGLVTLRAFYTAPFAGSWRFRGGVETSYASEDYMSEYFGINAADSARSGLSRFNADAGFLDVGLNASLTYMFNNNWSTTGTAKYARLLGDAEDSPVTDDAGSANQFFAGLLINYSF